MADLKRHEEIIKQIIANHLEANPEDLKPETTIKEDLGGDSIDVVEIVMQIEKEFNCVISDDRLAGFTTVGKFFDFIENIT